MFCKKCGKPIDDRLSICPYCGCAVGQAAPNNAPPRPVTGQGQAPLFAGNQSNFQPSPVNANAAVAARKKNTITMNKGVFFAICGAFGVIILILVIALIVTNVKSTGNSIVGAWKNPNTNEVQFEFFEDGTCSGTGDSYYEATENGLLRTYDSYHYLDDTLYYEVRGNKLYLASSKEQLEELIKEGQGFIRE